MINQPAPPLPKELGESGARIRCGLWAGGGPWDLWPNITNILHNIWTLHKKLQEHLVFKMTFWGNVVATGSIDMSVSMRAEKTKTPNSWPFFWGHVWPRRIKIWEHPGCALSDGHAWHIMEKSNCGVKQFRRGFMDAVGCWWWCS